MDHGTGNGPGPGNMDGHVPRSGPGHGHPTTTIVFLLFGYVFSSPLCSSFINQNEIKNEFIFVAVGIKSIFKKSIDYSDVEKVVSGN